MVEARGIVIRGPEQEPDALAAREPHAVELAVGKHVAREEVERCVEAEQLLG